jgi:type II secretory pathway component PulL
MMEMQTKQPMLWRFLVAAALLALALIFPTPPAAAQQQWTPQQRAACEPDAMRLCSQYVPDVQRTSACMSHYRRYLSPACRAVFSGGQRRKLRRA